MKHKRVSVTSPSSLPDLFASSSYSSLIGETKTLPLTGTKRDIRSRLREHCPDQPGVYGMVTGEGQLIYVGMSRSLKKRLQSYFLSRTSKAKQRRIAFRSTTLIWQPVAHELIARLRERELIHHGGVWGPLPLTKFLRRAVGELNHHFQLRDCPRETPISFKGDDPSPGSEHFTPCLRAELGTCLAPCLGTCTKTAYARKIQQAKRFLNGTAEEVFSELTAAMQEEVQHRRYEKAAILRDRLQALTRINQHLRRFHDWTAKANFIYPIRSSLDQREWWLLVARGCVIDVIPRPRNDDEKRATAAILRARSGEFTSTPDRSRITGPDEFESARLLFRWFRLAPEEKGHQLSLAKAVRLCQINSAITPR
jgi:excinuclease ABC subunit C